MSEGGGGEESARPGASGARAKRGVVVIFALLVACWVGLVFAAMLRRDAKTKRLAATDAASCAPWGVSLGETCGKCVAAFCCAEIKACYDDVLCQGLNDCWVKCGEKGEGAVPRAQCPAHCEERFPAQKSAFHAWDDCARRECGAQCPRGPSDEDD